jgi:hypothetical protein
MSVEVTESMDEFVIAAIAAICDLEDSQICLETALSDLAVDSLRITAFVAHLQAAHGCVVTPEDVIDLLDAPCVCDVVTIVRNIAGRPEACAHRS